MSLTSEREALAELVADATDIRVNAFVPGRLNPPEGMILPGSPYLEPGDTFGAGRFLARWDVVIATGAKVNDASTKALDDLIEDALVSLINGGYSVETVPEPYSITANGGTYLAVTITTTKQIQI